MIEWTTANVCDLYFSVVFLCFLLLTDELLRIKTLIAALCDCGVENFLWFQFKFKVELVECKVQIIASHYVDS